jgi:hypothetical protein
MSLLQDLQLRGLAIKELEQNFHPQIATEAISEYVTL